MTFISHVADQAIFGTEQTGVVAFNEQYLWELKVWFAKKFETIMQAVNNAGNDAAEEWAPTNTGGFGAIAPDEAGKKTFVPEWRTV